VEPARLLDLLELAAKLAHAGTDHAPVGLDLRLARTAEESEAAALALKVRPAAHQPALLVIEMGELDLQPAFGRCGAFAEDLQDQPGALELFLQVALLDRRQRAVDDHQFGLLLLALGGDPLDLAFAEQRAGPDGANGQDEGFRDVDADGQGEPLRLFEARLRIGRLAAPADIGADDDSPRAAGYAAFDFVAGGQAASPSSSSMVRSTGAAGWMVDTACL
jgi:hypothetical protein